MALEDRRRLHSGVSYLLPKAIGGVHEDGWAWKGVLEMEGATK